MREEKGGWKLKLGGGQRDGGSEGDGEIWRTERDKEEDNQAGVCRVVGEEKGGGKLELGVGAG